MVAETLLVWNALTNAVASWAGEVQGKEASRMLDAIHFAQAQNAAAGALLKSLEQNPEAFTEEQKVETVRVATELVKQGRLAVLDAAQATGLAIPQAVLDGFADFTASAESATARIGTAVKGQIIGITLVAAGAAAVIIAIAYFTAKAKAAALGA